jgi:topoisomerase-4 subunit A
MVKRFAIGWVTRDKEYVLTKGKQGSKVLYLTSNPNGEAEKVRVFLKQKAKLKKLQFDFDFSTLAIKGRASMGNILSRNPVRKVELCQKGVSTLSAINIYFDDIVTRLNTEERGVLLGSFKEDDKILTVYGEGYYKVVGFDLSTHFDDNLQIIKKLKKTQVLTAVYCNTKEGKYMIKRFNPENTPKRIDFVPQEKNVKLVCVSIDYLPQIEITYYTKNPKELEHEIVNCAEFVEVMGVKAKGKRLNFGTIKNVKFIDSLPYDEPEEEEVVETEDVEIEEVMEDIDMQVAKEIYDNVEEGQSAPKEKKESGEDVGEQLSLF